MIGYGTGVRNGISHRFGNSRWRTAPIGVTGWLARLLISTVLGALLIVPLTATTDAASSYTVKLGFNGAAKLTAGGPDQLYFNLVALSPGRWAAALYNGTCSQLGSRIVGLPPLVVTTGVVKRTDKLTRTQALFGLQGVVRIAQGSTHLCASFKPAVIPTPTAIPSPTPTATATPSPSPAASPFLTQTYSGSGNAFQPYHVPDYAAIAKMTHGGSRNFIVYIRHPDGKRDLLINTIGSYTGTVLLINGVGLEVTSDSYWRVDIESLALADEWGWTIGKLIGSSDNVLRVTPVSETTRTGRISIGSGFVAVWAYDADGHGTLVYDEIGPNSKIVSYPPGTWLLEILADTGYNIYPTK